MKRYRGKNINSLGTDINVCLEESIITKFLSCLEGCVLAKILNLTIGDGCTKSTRCKVDFGYKFKIFSRPKKTHGEN